MKTRRYMYNNLVLDSDNKIKIFSNHNDFFVIEKFDFWQNSIIIRFDLFNDINYINLFFIIKSYVLFKSVQPFALCTVFNVKNQILVTQKTNISWYVNMDYFMFKEWIEYRIKTDEKYEDESNFFGIILLYSKEFLLIYRDNNPLLLDILKPDYPWRNEWISHFEGQITKIDFLENKIKVLEFEIKNKKS